MKKIDNQIEELESLLKASKKVTFALSLKQLISDAIVSGSELQTNEDIKPLFIEYYKKLDKILDEL